MPATWAVWALTGGLWPVLAIYSPPGIAGDLRGSAGGFYEVAFVAGLAGGVLALHPLARSAWLLVPLSRTERFLGELAGLFATIVLFLLVALVPLALIGGHLLPPWTEAPAYHLFLTAMHISALALLVSRVPTSPGLHAALLVAICWWIPAALALGAGVLPALAAALDVSGRLASLHSPVETPPVALLGLAPTVAAALAAWLLNHPSPSRR